MPFTISQGRIFDPAGKPYIGVGVNARVSTFTQQMLSFFPGLNIVRCAIHDWVDPSSWAGFLSFMTQRDVLCVIERHFWPLQNATSGSALSQVAAWYGQWAAAYKGNDYVAFGSPNEPQGGDISGEHVGVYQAVRNAGSNALVFLEAGVGGGNPGMVGAGSLNPSAYGQMSRIVWDLHFYGWATKFGSTGPFNTNPAVVKDALMGNAAQHRGIAAAQAIQSADGLVPVFNGEFGVSTTGNPGDFDANGQQVVAAVIDAAAAGATAGFAGWVYDDDPSMSLAMINAQGTLTNWGQALAAGIKRLAGTTVPQPTTAPLPNAKESADYTTVSKPSDPPIIDASGEAWTIVATGNGQIAVNGITDTQTMNVTQIEYYQRTVYHQNQAGGWWTKHQGSDAWTPAAAPPAPVVKPTPADAIGQLHLAQAALDQVQADMTTLAGELAAL